jgi:hypothetical protein
MAAMYQARMFYSCDVLDLKEQKTEQNQKSATVLSGYDCDSTSRRCTWWGTSITLLNAVVIPDCRASLLLAPAAAAAW